MFLKISQNSHEETCVRLSFLIKLLGEACNFIKKETLVQMFSCAFRAIFKNTFFYRTPPVDVSVLNKPLKVVLIGDHSFGTYAKLKKSLGTQMYVCLAWDKKC